MTTYKSGRPIVAFLVLLLAAAVGCSSSKSSTDDCGTGKSLSQGGKSYCVYQAAIIEEGFLCPTFLPHKHQLNGLVVCSDDTKLPNDLDLGDFTDATSGADIHQDDIASTEDGDLQSDQTSTEPPKHTFDVTLTNNTGKSVFVDALYMPFYLKRDGNSLSYFSSCVCSKCGTGDFCAYGEPAPWAVEIPAGKSITVEVPLHWYTTKTVTAETCPETASWDRSCQEPHGFDPGSYEITIPYDTRAVVESQGLTNSGNLKWGQPLWTQQQMTIGFVTLSKRLTGSFNLSGVKTTLNLKFEENPTCDNAQKPASCPGCDGKVQPVCEAGKWSCPTNCTACGDKACHDKQVCVEYTGGPCIGTPPNCQATVWHECEPLPDACQNDKTCSCYTKNGICTGGGACQDNSTVQCSLP